MNLYIEKKNSNYKKNLDSNKFIINKAANF